MSFDLSKCVLGIELGSTRIKAVLIDENHMPIASGSHAWDTRLENGVWIYELEDALAGLRSCYADLRRDVEAKFGITPRRFAAMGVSGMMHGYLVFDRDGKQIAPFRTWRNTITGPAAAELSDLFRFNIPQRWSIAHLYQAILNEEDHVPNIARLTTLSGYIHTVLTGCACIGIGEASGMFPYDAEAADFDVLRLAQFDTLIAPKNLPWKLRDILPKVVSAGVCAGTLTAEGAALLDETGNLEAGIPLCPPEGDAGTGMIATGAFLPQTGSISAGTSAFCLQVLDAPMQHYYEEIDVVATPTGRPVALIQSNNCTPEIDAWVNLLADAAGYLQGTTDKNQLFSTLYRAALDGEPDCGGMVSFSYLAGDHLTKVNRGRPMLVRLPDSRLTLPNLMRAQLYGALATLCYGLDFLVRKEQVHSRVMLAHGGFFKTPGVGQQILADALEQPITALETAGEGGPWGMALLAACMVWRDAKESTEQYLSEKVFSRAKRTVVQPKPEGVAGFQAYMKRWLACLDAELAAGKME